jgi:pyrophosphatase PpaX
MTPPAALLFDLDGTLVDSIDLIVASFQATIAHFLDVAVPADAIVPQIGRSLFALFDEWDAARTPQMVAWYRTYMHAHHDARVRAFDGIAPLLDTLALGPLPLGIVTSKSHASAQPSRERFGLLAPRFSVFVGYDDTERHKPDPAPLLLAAERLGLPPTACWYIGDSVHDLHAARAADMGAIGAGWGPTPHAQLAPLADTVLQHPRALLSLLDRWGTLSP